MKTTAEALKEFDMLAETEAGQKLLRREGLLPAGLTLHTATPPAAQEAPWEPPLLLGHTNLPAFPVQCLPPEMRAYVLAVAEAMQVPADMAATAALAAVALAVQGKYIIKGKPDWPEPLNLFMVTVAPPAERKSAVMQAMTRSIHEYEQQANKELRPAIDEYQARRDALEAAAHEATTRAAKGKGSVEDAIQARHELSELQEIRPLRLMADDCTPEALTSLLAEQKGRMAIVSAEGGIFEILSGRYTSGPNIDVFLHAHAGEPIRVDRKGRQSEYIQHPVLTVLLAVQPVVLEGLMSNAAFRGRGLTARFLYSLPVSRVGVRKVETEAIPAQIAEAYRALMYNLLAIPMPEEAHALELSAEAYRLSVAFATRLEPRLVGDLEAIGDWAGKLHGAVLRIAGVLHMAQYRQEAAQVRVGVDTLQSAILIGNYFIEHAKAAYQLMGADQQAQDARYILRQLEKGQYEKITRSELTRLCRGRFQQIEGMNTPLQLLVDHGFIREERDARDGVGRRLITYKINPSAYRNNGNYGKNGSMVGINSILSIDSSTSENENASGKVII